MTVKRVPRPCRRKRVHIALTVLLGLAATLLLSLAWSAWALHRDAGRWLNERAHFMQNGSRHVRLSAMAMIDEAAAIRPEGDCDAALRDRLLPLLLNEPTILDLVITDENGVTGCSVLRGKLPLNLNGSALHLPEGFQAFNVALGDNAPHVGIAVRKGRVLAIVNEQVLVDMQLGMHQLQPQRRLFVGHVLLAQSKEAGVPDDDALTVTVSAPPQTSRIEVSLPSSEVWQRFWPFWQSRWLENLLLLLVVGGGGLLWGRRHFSLSHDIRAALRHREIRVHYQPVIALKTGRPASLEALLRWELTPADVLVEHAEQHGLIQALTRYVITQVLADLPQIQQSWPGLPVAVNLSPSDLAVPGFADWLHGQCMQQGVAPSSLRLEITERGTVAEGYALQTLRRLDELGYCLLIDDFGTGYSSLSYLHRLPVRMLKIDRSFVRALEEGIVSRSVVPQIAQMAHTLGLAVIAEGVETARQADMLTALQIRYAQGWLYSRALPLPALLAWLQEQRGLPAAQRQSFSLLAWLGLPANRQPLQHAACDILPGHAGGLSVSG